MNAALCLTTLILTALAPTTSHKQVRDGENRAWMLIRSKKVLVLHAPKAGQLQILARSAGAKELRVRAAGDVIAKEPLARGSEAVLPGQKTGPAALLRVPVPSGGEIFRVEVPRGRAWVAVSLLTPAGALAFEQPEAATPGLVGLMGPPKEETSVPGLVGLAPLVKPTPKAKPKPGLVALGSAQERKRNALKLAKKGDRLARAADAMNKADAKKKDQQGPAVIDRPITGLPPVEEQGEVVITQAQPKPKPAVKPAAPAGPTLLERLSDLELGFSLAGLAHGRADRMGGQVELEVDIPGTDRLMAAAFYVGYAPTQRSGVLRTGAGVALPLVVAQQTNEIPVGVTLRARPVRTSLAGAALTLFAEAQAGWHVRSGQTALGMITGSVSPSVNVASDGSGLAGGVGAGVELGLSSSLTLGAHARVEASAGQVVEAPGLIQGEIGQTGFSAALALRYRFGS